jgi:hypothetical protein
VLEAIASAGHNLGEDAATGEALAAAMADGHRAHPAPWPQPDDLERLLLLHSRRVLEEEGIPLSGLARALAERARPYLERAREMDWSPQGDTLAVLAVEAKGSVALAGPGGEPRHLRFKVDRVDLARSGLRLTDYKTGRPLSVLKKPEKRHRDHLARVRQGRALQSVAYLLAARAAGAGEARGRYLYLRPDADPEAAEYAVDAADAAFATAFADTAAVLFAAWDAGSFFPRLVDTAGEKEPSRCQYCRVAEACLRGDSGARRRLHRWASGATAGGEGEGAFLAVWNLADAGGGDPA